MCMLGVHNKHANMSFGCVVSFREILDVSYDTNSLFRLLSLPKMYRVIQAELLLSILMSTLRLFCANDPWSI